MEEMINRQKYPYGTIVLSMGSLVRIMEMINNDDFVLEES